MSYQPGGASGDNTYRLMELAIAFGQGSGTVELDPDAALELDKQYGAAVKGYQDPDWTRDRTAAFAWARVLGKLASQAAVASGRTVIGAEDVLSAKAAAQVADALPTGRCPFCPR